MPALVALSLAAAAGPLAAQRPVTLREAIDSALSIGTQVAVARADSAVARALLATAREFPNPAFLGGYSKSVPRYHLELEQPIDYPWVRGNRIRAARSDATAASELLGAERATVRHDVEVAYVNAAAAAAHARLSVSSATEAVRLLDAVRSQRDAGDASELDVRLAAITAGQLANAALADSADAVNALIALQVLIMASPVRVEISLADSLFEVPPEPQPPPEVPLRIAAARRSLESTRLTLRYQRGVRVPEFAVRAGIEFGDPTGSERGILPTVGVTVPIPIWNRNQGAIEEARAGVDRAVALVDAVERATAAAIAAAERSRATARERVARDREIVADAQRIADLSVLAYQEGAFTLATVLEAQRSARDVLRQYISDFAALRIAEADHALAVAAGVEAPSGVVPVIFAPAPATPSPVIPGPFVPGGDQ